MAKRTLNINAVGKHIGHACEGHLRAALQLYGKDRKLTVTRSFEIDGQVVKPDAVLINEKGQIAAVVICAFWDHAGSSEKKYYRTRIEYTITNNLKAIHPDLFTKTFRIVTIFYGSKTGWKSLILKDMESNCRPFIFLPKSNCTPPWNVIVNTANKVYLGFFESGDKKSREKTEEHFFAAQDKTVTAVLGLLESAFSGKLKAPDRANALSIHTPQTPPSGTTTRLRQAMSMLSLFRPKDVEEWHSSGGPVDEYLDFIRKACFYDLVTVLPKKRANGKAGLQWAFPRAAINDDGSYAPGKPDFMMWCKHRRETVVSYLKTHQVAPMNYSSMSGAVRDQCYGNIAEIYSVLSSADVDLQKTDYSNLNDAWNMVKNHNIPVRCEEWHPCFNGDLRVFPLRDLFACAVACVANDRSIRGELGFGASSPELNVSSVAVAIEPKLVLQEVNGALAFMRYVMSADLVDSDVQIPPRPALLSLDRPESFVSGVYNFLTTHPSHNPLGFMLQKYLSHHYPELEWIGWPQKRSVPLSEVIAGTECRREWQMYSVVDGHYYFAEVKSITDNNWGNKSKELYDRILDTRSACDAAGGQCTCICLFDGDLFEQAHIELMSGIGYDIVLSVDDVFNIN